MKFNVVAGLTWKFGRQHLAAAAFFSKKCLEIEESFENAKIEDFPVQEHRWYVFSAIIMAHSTIEANLNEIVREVPKTGDIKDIIKLEYFPGGFEKKCEEIYKATTGKVLKAENPLYFEAKILNELRNFLIHPRPITHWGNKGEWEPSYDDESKIERARKRLEELPESLKRLPVKPNPLFATNPFFPDQIISHGYAEWAVQTAYKFITLFRTDSGLGMEDFKGDFSTR